MKRPFSFLLILFLLLTVMPVSYADRPLETSVYELYSVEGSYEDGVGNRTLYSYHIPQILDSAPAADEINREIAETFGKPVEEQFQYMEDGVSLSLQETRWESYWNGSQLFLLIISEYDADLTEYGAYGYDFETGERITNEMILKQKGISEEQYLKALTEAVTRFFDEQFQPLPEGVETGLSRDSLLEDTLGWLSAERPIFLNREGEIETWVEIATPAGAGKYSHLIAPFSDSSGKTYQIRIVGAKDLVESCPETAKAGETVTVTTLDVTDGDKEITVSGVEGTAVNGFEYQFVMPDHDVEVRVRFIGNGLA